MKFKSVQQGFGYGEIGKKLRGKTGSEIYANGLGYAQRCFFDSSGCIVKSSGTKHVKLLPSATEKSRLYSFMHGNVGYFVLFGEKKTIGNETKSYIAFYVADTEQECNAIECPYDDEDIYNLDIKDINGEIYIVHRKYEPRRITNTTNSVIIEYGDMDGTATVNKTIAATEKHINALKPEIEFNIEIISVAEGSDYNFREDGLKPDAQTFFAGRWFLGGCNNNPTTIYGSRTPDVSISGSGNRFNDFSMSDKYTKTTKHTRTIVYTYIGDDGAVREPTSTEEPNYSSSDNKKLNVLWGKVFDDDDSIENNIYATYDSSSVTEAPRDKSDFEHESPKTRSIKFTELNGNSESSSEQSQKTFCAVTEEISWTVTEFTEEVFSDHAIELVESDAIGARIKWLESSVRLLAGYGRTIWMDSGNGFTPEKFDMVKTLAIQNSFILPVQLAQFTIFVGNDFKSIYSIAYDDNAGGFTSNRISDTADHLFDSNVRQLAVCDGNMPTLFVLLENGKLLSCSINVYAGSFGWSRYILDSSESTKIHSISALHAYDRDYLFMTLSCHDGIEIRKAVINSSTDDSVYLDDYKVYESLSSIVSFRVSSPYKAGDKIHVVAGGKYIGEKTVGTDGMVSIDGLQNCKKVEYGKKYSMNVETLNQEMPTQNSMTSLGNTRQINGVTAFLVNSYVFDTYTKITDSWIARWNDNERKSVQECGQTYGEGKYSLMEGSFTGYVDIRMVSLEGKCISIGFESSLPVPLNIASVIGIYNVKEV